MPTSTGRSGVRNNNPNVPSRRSRLMLSQVMIGTSSQIRLKSVGWSTPNITLPLPAMRPSRCTPTITVTPSITPAPSTRSQ
jgi:hypothetical protein